MRWTRDCGHARPHWPKGKRTTNTATTTTHESLCCITNFVRARRLWTDPEEDREVEALPQQVFNRFSVFRSRLIDLGLKAEPIFPKFCAQNQNECN